MGESSGPTGIRATAWWAVLRRWWYRLLEEASPAAYCAWNRRFPERQVVTRHTDLVIEGYPSAANSWLREALQHTQPGIRVASHLHSPAHVERAVRLGVPTLVLLRPPAVSVASLLARFPDLGLQPRRELRRYRRFYRRLLRDTDGVVLVRFEEAIDSIDSVIHRVNGRFGTSFRPAREGDAELRQRVFSILDESSQTLAGDRFEELTPRPSGARVERAAQLRVEVEGAAPKLLAECQRLYEALAARAGEERRVGESGARFSVGAGRPGEPGPARP